MNIRLGNIFWGVLLILAGGIFLAQNLGYLGEWSAQVWMWFLAGVSLAFFVTYIATGFKQWGWLFPACMFAGTAITIALAEAGVRGSLVAVPVLAGAGLPFFIVFAYAPRQHWWALIPAWVMSVVTLIVFVAERVPGEFMGTIVLYSIGLPFLVVYLLDREKRWALIPAFVLMAVGTIPLLATRFSGELVGSLVLFMFALPFFVVYFVSERSWWALIPAGLFASAGVLPLLLTSDRFDLTQTGIPSGIMLLGWALTFGLLWLRRSKQPTAWAGYPAIVFAFMSAASFVTGSNLEKWWPVIPIMGGVLLLFLSLRPRPAH